MHGDREHGHPVPAHPVPAWPHALSPHVKLVFLVAFAVVVVATPREWFVVFAWYALLVLALLRSARVPGRRILARCTVEAPFVLFALLMPFVAEGPRLPVAGMMLATEGLWGAWALLAKATLALLAAVWFTAVTEPRRIVGALSVLRMPAQLTSIMAFMLRYVDVIAGEAARMRVARESRGFRPRGLRGWHTLARSVGALFVRAHSRGEHVHLAMLARGGGGASG